jgi:hypothetical protein
MPSVPAAQVVLAGVVGPVREPEADDRRAHLLRNLDAFQAVAYGLRANARVGVADAAEPIVVVAEEVRVDPTDADALPFGERAQLPVVVDGVPGDVQRDAGAAPGEPVDERGIGDPLADLAGSSRPRVHVEPRPRVAVPPGRRLDLEAPEPPDDRALVHRSRASHIPEEIANGLSFSSKSKVKAGS